MAYAGLPKVSPKMARLNSSVWQRDMRSHKSRLRHVKDSSSVPTVSCASGPQRVCNRVMPTALGALLRPCFIRVSRSPLPPLQTRDADCLESRFSRQRMRSPSISMTRLAPTC